MIESISDINFIIVVAGFVLCVLGLVETLIGRHLEEHTRQFFITFFTILTGYVFFNFLGQLTDSYTGVKWAIFSRFTLFSESLLSSILTVLITGFILYQSGEKAFYKKRTLHISLGIWIVYVIFLIYTQFFGVFYYIDDNNTYHRGSLYPLLLVPPALIMFFNIFVLWKSRAALSKQQKKAFAVYTIVPLVAMFIQMISFGIYYIVIGSVIATLFMFTYIVHDQNKRYYTQLEENAQLKIDILLAQIQPHFLFNSLTTIKHLCKKDPEKAEQAVSDFTTYLRHNMDSLSMDSCIPFADELSHVRCYLALQKLRFGDELLVEYELETEKFNIPTLTLQPLVENAVTYGVRRSESGKGTVKIKTAKFDDHIEISVIDDGPGFVSEALQGDKERSHTGINNVRERLNRIAGGELMIESEPGKGTKAVIMLPQGE